MKSDQKCDIQPESSQPARARLMLDPAEVLGPDSPEPYWCSHGGVLFSGDCLDYLWAIKDEVIDTVFADPPFNLRKPYGGDFDDNLADDKYLDWSKTWLGQCIRVLKPGGSIFLYNLPRWNIPLGAFLMQQGLIFRHWIAIEIKTTLPIEGRLYPAHYGLLYFSKGKPKTFRRIRTPILKCRHCGGEVRDYGGHRHAMNPNGVTLMDVWDDIPPVRHGKYKSAKRTANAISTKILDRVVEMSTNPREIILDPFGGSGTTYSVAFSKGRRWIGMELKCADVVIERLTTNPMPSHANADFVEPSRVIGRLCLPCSQARQGPLPQSTSLDDRRHPHK